MILLLNFMLILANYLLLKLTYTPFINSEYNKNGNITDINLFYLIHISMLLLELS